MLALPESTLLSLVHQLTGIRGGVVAVELSPTQIAPNFNTWGYPTLLMFLQDSIQSTL
jgi:hypothetical protein